MKKVNGDNPIQRCGWCNDDPQYIAYHDTEWGIPVHDDLKLFEFLILESMQAGLSWLTILKRRVSFSLAFDHFNPQKIARYTHKKILMLMDNPNIIRNERKINASIQNARAFLKIKDSGLSFNDYLWQFTHHRTIYNQWHTHLEVPAFTPLSEKMSKQLKHDGFIFVGPTICYALMQAIGMVDDHILTCFKREAPSLLMP